MSWFWEIVESWGDAHRQLLLLFVTSTSRGPLLGFGDLHPSFAIQMTQVDPQAADSEIPLPSASTCFNLLRLPHYASREIMKRKLEMAINSGAGFEMS